MLTLLSLRMSRRRWRQGSGEDTQKPLLRAMQSRGFWLGERVSRAWADSCLRDRRAQGDPLADRMADRGGQRLSGIRQ
jgi:hypothetical protein